MADNKALTVLVGLDLSEMDYFLIKYMKLLHQTLSIEKVTFFHNIKLGELPNDFVLPERLKVIQDKIKTKLDNKVKEQNPDFPYDSVVTTESYSASAFSSYFRRNPVDLLVMGNKQNLEGNGALPRQLLGLVPSSVLMVPETYSDPINTVMEAIDFSKYTPSIMKWARLFQSKPEVEIRHSPIHVTKFYWEEYLPSSRVSRMEKAVEKNTEQKKLKWEQEYPDFNSIEIIPAEDRSISTTLLQYADRKRAGIMILGVLGSFGIREIFIGSVANRLLGRATNTCLLFVKHRKK